MSSPLSRRSFLKKTALAAGAVGFPTVVPARVLGREGSVPPSEQIVLGFIGVRNMGGHHLSSFLGRAGVRIVAVCDVSAPERDGARGTVGGDCVAYSDYRNLLAREDIDGVVISTPDHWHTLIGIHACEAGKDVLCEKPLTLTIAEGRHLVNAARRYGRIFQVGSQQRSDRNFRHACELVRNGRIGKLITVKTNIGWGPTCEWEPNQDPPPGLDWDMWLGPAPYVPYNRKRCFYDFRWFFDYSGGKMTDWGAHHNDIAQWGIGADDSGPISVEGTGGLPAKGLYETFVWYKLTYTYANGVGDGWMGQR
jgi:predicted dehydrogenase